MMTFNTYSDLIEYFKQNPPTSCYVEKHHIIPKCMGGLDNISNIIELPLQYHLYAHYLLAIECQSEKDSALNFLACQMILNNPKGCNQHDIFDILKDEVFLKILEDTRQRSNKIKRICVYKEDLEKHIFLEELQSYLDKGWNKGRPASVISKILNNRKPSTRSNFTHSEETKKLISERTKQAMKTSKNIGRKKGTASSSRGKIVITNGSKNRYINPTDEIPNGWWRGSTQIHLNQQFKKAYVNKDGIIKVIAIEELELYLKDGWSRGFRNVK